MPSTCRLMSTRRAKHTSLAAGGVVTGAHQLALLQLHDKAPPVSSTAPLDSAQTAVNTRHASAHD